VNVAVCQQLATTGASVTSNVATYTFGSNPITQGFVSGATLTVFGFTGGDTYFNGTFTIASTSASTISVALVHANASAGTNGTVYQIGTSTQACAPLATLYTFYTALTTSPNPLTADGLGNYGFWAVPGQYEVQLYGPTVTTSFFYVSMACVPNASVTCVGTFSGSVANGQVAYGAGANVFASDGSLLHSPGGNTSLSATSPATNVHNIESASEFKF
jgi:hypothetical protein